MADRASSDALPAGRTISRPKRKSSLPKLIEKYYADLRDLAHQNVMYEMGTRPAFHALLQAVGKENGWTLIAEHEKKVNGKTIRPDGTFKDAMNLVRGYWEAKDTSDKLDVEIEKKRKAGYPLSNIIFEDTATAVLYQHGQRLLTADMNDPAKLAGLVSEFFRYVEPEIEQFEHAVEEFKQRVPELAEGLKKKIEQAHKANPAFKQAFADFFDLCRTSLNPNLAKPAVDEMLIQHILTERLIREIFDNPEFVRRNVIAAEVEKVMLAMTSQSFDRNTYLKDLDRFYIAIERAARTMQDWSDKQYFLNTVYERFFQGYSVKLADTMGIVYTPQEIVDFMCASVAEVLEKEFGKKLWSEDVYIIDPCTGTGNFIVNLIRRIPKAQLEDVYRHRLFANEIMLLPYYIAALNIEHAFFEQMGRYEGFEGLCFVDTLDLADAHQLHFADLSEKNAERVAKQKRAPITVVIGNPPWNVGQEDENLNNKNRPYGVVDQRIRMTFVEDSAASLHTKLYDAYMKFFRWAMDRLEGRNGIVCFVSNNGFLHGIGFDGFRQHMSKDFDLVYHVDLKGNARTSGERRKREGGNVFSDQIRAGVGITLLARGSRATQHVVNYFAAGDAWRAEQKKELLVRHPSVGAVPWRALPLDEQGDWQLSTAPVDEHALPIGSKDARGAVKGAHAIFADYSLGVSTNRDAVVYDFSRGPLEERIPEFVDAYNAEADRYARKGRPANVDDFVDYSKVKWSSTLKGRLKRGQAAKYDVGRLRPALYRPFQRLWLYYDAVLNDRPGMFREVFPNSDAGNHVIAVSDIGFRATGFSTLMSGTLIDLHLCAAVDAHQCFPRFVYDEDGTNRRENITDWALDQFRKHYHDDTIDKHAIFHYVYGVLHHPGYREKFADNLKRELPRIPFAPDFWNFAEAGTSLAALHLNYEKLDPWELEFIETPGVPLSYRVDDKMRLNKEKTRLTINPSLTLAGIPPQAFDYRLGNRSALEWVIDQFQITTDKRSGITTDPNRDDDPQYIVRLVGQVTRVSVETVKIVSALPPQFASNPG
jgi:predicted helicase